MKTNKTTFVFLPKDSDDPGEEFVRAADEEKVTIERHFSRDGREWFLYKRYGYPVFTRRKLLSPEKLASVYLSDSQVRLR